MSMEKSVRPARMIVVGNEKGGSGKSTVAIHIAVALMKAGQSVATVDLDARQRSFTHYVENRRAWSQRVARDLETPDHYCLEQKTDHPTAEDDVIECNALTKTVENLAGNH